MAEKILPSDPTKAVKHIVGIVEQLLRIMEKESMALAMNDAVAFTASQEEKKVMAESYQKCSNEFRNRLTDFRFVDKALLDRLDTLQRELAIRSKENMKVMERMG